MATTYSQPKPVMLQLQALALFHTHGMKAVERMFPQFEAFVKANKNRPFQDIKEELLHASCSSAA